MNKELYIHTLRMLREQYEIARMDTVVETIDAALAEFERPTDRDCISRQAAIDAFNCTNELIIGGEANAQNVVNYINKVVGKIKDLPSAQPEIIRCKECSKWQTIDCQFFSKYITVMPNEEQYCSLAERRNDG